AAFDALVRIDVRLLVLVEADGPARAGGGAAVRQAAAAGVRHLIGGDGTFVAGDADDLDGVGVILVAAHGELQPLGHDGALFVNAAAHGRLRAGRDDLGDFRKAVQ